jgi:hypothetical protein
MIYLCNEEYWLEIHDSLMYDGHCQETPVGTFDGRLYCLKHAIEHGYIDYKDWWITNV